MLRQQYKTRGRLVSNFFEHIFSQHVFFFVVTVLSESFTILFVYLHRVFRSMENSITINMYEYVGLSHVAVRTTQPETTSLDGYCLFEYM